MATSLQCPECQAMLKLASAIAPGLKVQCPRCRKLFVPITAPPQVVPLPDEPTGSPIQSQLPPALRPTKATPVPAEDSKRVQKTQPARPSAEQSPNKSQTVHQLDDDEAPPVRQPAAKPRPAARQDDEEAQPQRKSLANPPRRERDDDNDDRPRKTSVRRRHDDDDDWPPRSRKSRKSRQKSGSGLVIGLVAGGVVLLCTLGGLGAVLLSGKGKDKDSVALSTPGAGGSSTADEAIQNPPKKPTQETPARLGERESPISATPKPSAPTPTHQNPPGELTSSVQERTQRATVLVAVKIGNKGFTGSGFIVKASGDTAYVVTNHHVVSDDESGPTQGKKTAAGGGPPPPRPPGFPQRPGFGPPSFGPTRPLPFNNRPQTPQQQMVFEPPEVSVILNRGNPDERRVDAKLVASDAEADLAVIRMVGVRNLPPALELADESTISETMPAYIFGFPGGSKNIVIGKASVSQLRRDEKNEIFDLQLNGELNPGNSGGPVIDSQGRVVGVAVSTVLGKNVGWAVPVSKLNQMFRGSISGGLLLAVRQQGNAAQLVGEMWHYDRKNNIRKHLSLTPEPLSGKDGLPPPEELFIYVGLTDPMQKIQSATLNYVQVKDQMTKPGASGWEVMPNAQKLALQLGDQDSKTVLRIPGVGKSDEMYAFQISYVDGDNRTIVTEPHYVRMSFPRTSKGP